MTHGPRVSLRPMEVADTVDLLANHRDPKARRMAAFASHDVHDRDAFLARWEKLLKDGAVTARMILLDGETAGSIASWGPHEERQVTYWIWREHWGKGAATEALRQFLDVEKTRPLRASVAADNAGSLRVLEKCGFERTGSGKAFAAARGAEVEEVFFVLR